MSWRKIGLDSIYVTAGTVATQLLQWIILASIARIEGPRVLGLYALAQAFALPLQYLAWLSIRQRYLTLRDDDGSLPDFVFLRWSFPALVFLLSFAGIATVYSDKTFVWLSGLLFLSKYVEGFYDLIYAVMQKEGNAKRIAKLSIVRTVVSGAIFVLCYLLTKNLYASMLATTIQQIVLLLFVSRSKETAAGSDWRSVKLDRAIMRKRLGLAIELLPVSVSLVVMSLNTSVPRLLLDSMVGAKELGYFAAVGSFISLGAIAVGSLGQSLLQPLSTSIREREQRTFWLQLLWPMCFVVAICGVGALVSLVAGQFVLKLVYGPAFASISPLLFCGAVASGPIFAASIASVGVFAAYLKSAFFWSQLAAAVFSAAGVIVLAPSLRIQGVFLALALSGVLQILLSCAVLRRFWSSLSKDSVGRGDTSKTAVVEL